jgi:hypothetical protein
MNCTATNLYQSCTATNSIISIWYQNSCPLLKYSFHHSKPVGLKTPYSQFAVVKDKVNDYIWHTKNLTFKIKTYSAEWLCHFWKNSLPHKVIHTYESDILNVQYIFITAWHLSSLSRYARDLIFREYRGFIVVDNKELLRWFVFSFRGKLQYFLLIYYKSLGAICLLVFITDDERSTDHFVCLAS